MDRKLKTVPKFENLMPEEFEVKTRKPKILFWDIENAPNRSFTWGKWKQNVIAFDSEWYLLSFSVKWLGGKQITKCLADYEGYKPNSEDDKALTEELWTYLDAADILVAHNGDKFDTKKVFTKFIEHGLMPPKPAKSIDTLKVARRRFAFNSNKLDDLGRRLGVGRKLQHNGFELWLGCMNGDPKAWSVMKKYNSQDVRLLQSVYEKLLPYIDNHPNVTVMAEKEYGCRNCGSKNIHSRGRQFTSTGFRNRYQCNDCKTWMSGKHKPLVEIR